MILKNMILILLIKYINVEVKLNKMINNNQINNTKINKLLKIYKKMEVDVKIK